MKLFESKSNGRLKEAEVSQEVLEASREYAKLGKELDKLRTKDIDDTNSANAKLTSTTNEILSKMDVLSKKLLADNTDKKAMEEYKTLSEKLKTVYDDYNGGVDNRYKIYKKEYARIQKAMIDTLRL